MDIIRWSISKSDWLYSLSQRRRSSIQSAKTRLGADCGSDYEFLIAKFIFKLKKVGETTRPFRYDLSQIPYEYAVEVRNRFKGLDLIDRMPDELWTEVCDTVQESRPSPRKRNGKGQKDLFASQEEGPHQNITTLHPYLRLLSSRTVTSMHFVQVPQFMVFCYSNQVD